MSMAETEQQRDRLDTDEKEVLGKSEVLLLDRDEAERERLVELLEAAKIIVTATDDERRALQLARDKHFAAILLDADTPQPEGGLEQVPLFVAAAPASSVVLLAQRPAFKIATEGFRQGAADVVSTTSDNTQYLMDRVVSLCLEAQRAEQRDRLLTDTLQLHDLFLRQLMEAHRRAEEAEERASGQMGSGLLQECVILVADANTRTAPGLEQALGSGFRCASALNGGEALDYAGSQTFHIALVNDALPDLSGTMVAKTLRSQKGDFIVLLFAHPGKQPGYVSIVEAEQTFELVPQLKSPAPLVDRIRELRNAYAAKQREKKYVQSFRQTHGDFIRRYVEVRQQIQKLKPEGQR
jgi:DNA-binding response OmpR family regulator